MWLWDQDYHELNAAWTGCPQWLGGTSTFLHFAFTFCSSDCCRVSCWFFFFTMSNQFINITFDCSYKWITPWLIRNGILLFVCWCKKPFYNLYAHTYQHISMFRKSNVSWKWSAFGAIMWRAHSRLCNGIVLGGHLQPRALWRHVHKPIYTHTW